MKGKVCMNFIKNLMKKITGKKPVENNDFCFQNSIVDKLSSASVIYKAHRLP